MRFLDIAFGALLLAVAAWGLTWRFRARRRAREAEDGDDEAVVDGAAPAVSAEVALAEVGFGEVVVVDGRQGARGLFHGVSLLALPRGRRGDDAGWVVTVELPPEARRLRVRATPQGLTRKRRSLVLGIAGVDARLDVSGDRADALALFGRPGARALIDAVALHGWQLEDGELRWEGATLGTLDVVVTIGAGAGRVLLGLSA